MINTRIVFAAMLAITLLVVVVPVSGQTTLFQCTDGVVILKSDATLELIQAKSHLNVKYAILNLQKMAT